MFMSYQENMLQIIPMPMYIIYFSVLSEEAQDLSDLHLQNHQGLHCFWTGSGPQCNFHNSNSNNYRGLEVDVSSVEGYPSIINVSMVLP